MGEGAGRLAGAVISSAAAGSDVNATLSREQKEKQSMLSALAVGDSVLTTAGFYGVVIDMTEDTVIVEFGNNKNCRIPMQKAAIVQIEKPEDALEAANDK